MIYSELLQQNNRIRDFYAYLKDLPQPAYSRAQHHCKHFFGGFIRGIYKDNGVYYFKLES